MSEKVVWQRLQQYATDACVLRLADKARRDVKFPDARHFVIATLRKPRPVPSSAFARETSKDTAARAVADIARYFEGAWSVPRDHIVRIAQITTLWCNLSRNVQP